MRFDWVINIGQVFQIVGFVGAVFAATLRVYHLIDRRMTSLEAKMTSHSQSLIDHGARMDRYEEQMLKIISDVQRIIGRLEVATERRSTRRESD